MKELFAGLVLAAVLAAAVTSSHSGGGEGRVVDRRTMWDSLRNREEAPDIRNARFVGPRNAPIRTASPAVLLDPAKRFAESMTAYAAEIGETAGPELGATWLVAEAARLAADPGAARAKGATSPLPTPRPDPARASQGVLSAALGLLEKAGLEALRPASPDRSMTDAASAKAPPPGRAVNADPVRRLPATHADRAPGRPI